MGLVIIFFISGFAIILLLLAKKIEERRRRPVFILRAISKTDAYVRAIHHDAVHLYVDGKEKTSFLFYKQIPIRVRNLWNKFLTLVQEKRDLYMTNMRDSRLLRKQDGLSEFIKNMGDIEKGNGEINDSYLGGSQETQKEVE